MLIFFLGSIFTGIIFTFLPLIWNLRDVGSPNISIMGFGIEL